MHAKIFLHSFPRATSGNYLVSTDLAATEPLRTITRDILFAFLSARYLPHQLKCCGAVGPSSYGSQPLPASCTQSGEQVKKSCADAIREEFFKNKAYALALGGIGALLIVLLVI